MTRIKVLLVTIVAVTITSVASSQVQHHLTVYRNHSIGALIDRQARIDKQIAQLEKDLLKAKRQIENLEATIKNQIKEDIRIKEKALADLEQDKKQIVADASKKQKQESHKRVDRKMESIEKSISRLNSEILELKNIQGVKQ